MQTAFYATPDFWAAVAFFIALGSVFRRVVNSIKVTLDDRAKKIKASLDEARCLREEAQQLLAECQRKQRDAVNEAENIISCAKTEVERQKQQTLVELEEMTMRREAQAMSRIVQAETKAIVEVRNLAIYIAMVATKQLIVENLDKDQMHTLANQAILELPSRFTL